MLAAGEMHGKWWFGLGLVDQGTTELSREIRKKSKMGFVVRPCAAESPRRPAKKKLPPKIEVVSLPYYSLIPTKSSMRFLVASKMPS